MVLHRVLQDNTLYDDVVAVCSAEDFRSFVTQETFRLIGKLIASGRVADPASVFQAAVDGGVAQDITASFLLGLFQDWTSHDPVTHAKYVRDKAILRRLRKAGEEIVERADQHFDAAEQLEEAERAVLAIADADGAMVVDAAEASVEAFAILQRRIGQYERKEVSGVASGLSRFDDITNGFQPSEVAIVAARTSVGKTVFGLNVAANACKNGVTTAFVTLEQPKSELFLRLWSSLSGVDSWRIRRGCLHDHEKKAMASARDVTSKWPLFVLDQSGQTITRIGSTARRLKRKHNLGLLVIDYLGLIDAEDRKQPRHEQVSIITRRTKLLARELGVPILLLCQLNREADKEEPRLSHLRESGSIEQDADTVILLHRDDDKPGEQPPEWIDVKVRIAKQRNGPTEAIFVQMHRPTFRFVDKKEF